MEAARIPCWQHWRRLAFCRCTLATRTLDRETEFMTDGGRCDLFSVQGPLDFVAAIAPASIRMLCCASFLLSRRRQALT